MSNSMPETPTRTPTIGEQRVRAGFNPSEDSNVKLIKREIATLIDQVEALKDKDPRLAAIAQTKLEEAAMFAVKLATA